MRVVARWIFFRVSPNINVVEIVMEARVLVCTKEPFSFYPNVTEKESQASMQSSEKRALDIQKNLDFIS